MAGRCGVDHSQAGRVSLVTELSIHEEGRVEEDGPASFLSVPTDSGALPRPWLGPPALAEESFSEARCPGLRRLDVRGGATF